MWKLKPKYKCEIFVTIFGHTFLTNKIIYLKGKSITYKTIRVLLKFSFN